MPLNSQSIVLSLAWILMVIPLRAQEAETKHDVPTLEITGSLVIPDLAMPRAALSPDGERLVAPLRDDRLAVWNMGDRGWCIEEWELLVENGALNRGRTIPLHPDLKEVFGGLPHHPDGIVFHAWSKRRKTASENSTRYFQAEHSEQAQGRVPNERRRSRI